MKISQAIAKLQEKLAKHGDLQIFDADGWPSEDFMLVTKQPDGWSFDGVYVKDNPNSPSNEEWCYLDEFIMVKPGG